MRWRCSRKLGLALLATNLLGCGAPDDRGLAGEPEGEDVGAIAQPLGGTVPVAALGGHTLLNIGPSLAVYASNGCPQTVQVRSVSNGASLLLGEFPGCSASRAVSDSAVFVASETGTPRIFSSNLFEGFVPIASFSPPLRGRMLLDSQNVYFADGVGLKKVPRSGGAVTLIKAGSGISLFALDGNLLYFRISNQLRRITVFGSSEAVMHNNVAGIADVTFDSASLYFAINGQISRMAKTPGAFSFVLHTSTALVSDLVTASGNLYWIETRPVNRSSIHRRTSVGTVTVEKVNLSGAQGLRAASGSLVWNETFAGSPTVQRLSRASLP